MINQKILHILLVEDNPGDAHLIEMYLRETVMGSEISLDKSETFHQALKMASEANYKVILLDLSLPDGLEFEMIQMINKVSPQTAIIVLTGREGDNFALKALKSGAQDYLNKNNVDSKLLTRSIRYALERHSFSDTLNFKNSLLETETQSSLDGIIRILADGTIYSVNDAFLDFWSLEASSATDCKELVQKMGTQLDGQSKLIRVMEQTEGDKKYFGEVILKNGQCLEYLSIPIKTKTGKYYGVTWSFRNVTERKRLEQMKDDFLSTISHELRTPLAIVKGAVSNLKDGILGVLSEKQQKVIETTDRNIGRLARLINDLLDISRLESGKVSIHLSPIILPTLLHEIVFGFRHLADEKKIGISLEINEGLSSMVADADMMTQVMTNLLSNALCYANSSIQIKAFREESSKVHIIVQDDGPGISAEHLSLLFNKFQQINRPRGGSGYKGTGLGLAICKEIINLHNGEIWVESELGKGAAFHLLIP